MVDRESLVRPTHEYLFMQKIIAVPRVSIISGYLFKANYINHGSIRPLTDASPQDRDTAHSEEERSGGRENMKMRLGGN